MFLLKCKIKGLPEFQSHFSSTRDAEKYIDSIDPEIVEDWSIHPLFVQDAIKCKDKSAKVSLNISVQMHGDTRIKPVIHNISVENLFELVLKDFDFTDVYKLILFPRA